MSCVAVRFPPVDSSLLPDECAHSSVLVVWGYLGWAIPCLMSSEAKISILALEWLGSLWEHFCCSSESNWNTCGEVQHKRWVEEQRERADNHTLRDTHTHTDRNISVVVRWKPILSSPGWDIKVTLGLMESRPKPVLHIVPGKVDTFGWNIFGSDGIQTTPRFWAPNRWGETQHPCMHPLSNCGAKIPSVYCEILGVTDDNRAVQLESLSTESRRLCVWMWRGWASRCHRTNELIY